jgi:ankyrin repeat protein
LAEAVASREYPNSAIAKTKLLLAAGANANLSGKKRPLERTFPLFLAAQTGNLEVVELLIEHGADVNKEIPLLFFSFMCVKKNSKGKFVQYRPTGTPLSAAVKSKSLPMVRLLLKHGAKTNRELADEIKKLETLDEAIETDLFAILKGSFFGQFEKVRKAIAAGTDLSALDCCNETILEKVSSRRGNIDLINLLLKHNAKRKDVALCKAIEAGNVDAVKLLLKNGADTNAISFQHLFPRPVFFLSNRNATKILPLLLEAGAKINYKNDQGQNVLGVLNGRSKTDIELWKALIQAGANWKNVDKSGKSILERIIQRRRTGLVKLFIDHGASPETVRALAQKHKRKNLLFLLDKVWRN